MSGHTPWKLLRQRRIRTLTHEQRAAERARHAKLIDDLRFQVWRLRVEEKLVRALAAAAAGEPIEWAVWPPTDPQEVIDSAAAKFGFDPFPAAGACDSTNDDADPDDGPDATLFAGMLAAIECWSTDHVYGYTSVGAPDMASMNAMLAAIPPRTFVSEIRLGPAAMHVLRAILPHGESPGYAWGMPSAISSTPLVLDLDVAPGYVRLVRGDGSSQDVALIDLSAIRAGGDGRW